MAHFLRIESAHRLARDGIADFRNRLPQANDTAPDRSALNDVLIELAAADQFCIPGASLALSGSATFLDHFLVPALQKPLSLVFQPADPPGRDELTPVIQCVVALPVPSRDVPDSVRGDFMDLGVDHHGSWVKIVDAYTPRGGTWCVTPYCAYMPCGVAPDWQGSTSQQLGVMACAHAFLPVLAAAIERETGPSGAERVAKDACNAVAAWLWFEVMRSCLNVTAVRSDVGHGDWSNYLVSRAAPHEPLYSGRVEPYGFRGALWSAGAVRSPFLNDPAVQAFLAGGAVPRNGEGS